MIQAPELFYYFLIELTKQCNQRCSYCYQREYAADPHFISLADLERMLRKIKSYCLENKINKIRLCYIGGEVLTLGLEYLSSLFVLSRDVFKGASIQIEFGMDTNLTLLNQEHIKILKEHGVAPQISFDIFGDQRQFANGEPIQQIIIDKIALLVRNNIPFSVVTVITKQNCKKGAQIYDFCNQINAHLHILKMDPPYGKPLPKISPSDQDYIKCLKAITKRYLGTKKTKIPVSFIASYINLLSGREPILCKFSKTCLDNHIFIENNGDVYPCCALRYYVKREAPTLKSCNLHYTDLRLGNILKDSLNDIFNAPILSWLKTRQHYIEKECAGCKYLNICNGGCMAIAYKDGNIMGRSRSYCAINKNIFQFLDARLHKMSPKKTNKKMKSAAVFNEDKLSCASNDPHLKARRPCRKRAGWRSASGSPRPSGSRGRSAITS